MYTQAPLGCPAEFSVLGAFTDHGSISHHELGWGLNASALGCTLPVARKHRTDDSGLKGKYLVAVPMRWEETIPRSGWRTRNSRPESAPWELAILWILHSLRVLLRNWKCEFTSSMIDRVEHGNTGLSPFRSRHFVLRRRTSHRSVSSIS